jgi:hypothetical protein
MRTSALTGIAASAAALALVLAGCGSQTAPATSSPQPAPTSAKLAKPVQNDGPNPTVADYLRDHKITEDQVHRGDAGAPKIDLPTPQGWKSAGDDTPDWAYDSIVYSGSTVGKDSDYTPSIIALLSKLTGPVDAKALLAVAPGELQNLPGFKATGPGTATTLGAYPAYQSAGTWTADGKTKFVAQQTVVIPAKGGATYVLQLNSDGMADQSALVQAATVLVDQQTKVTL